MKAINSNDPHDWACFKRMRNKVKVAIRQAKELFYKNKFSESYGDPRKTWLGSMSLLLAKMVFQ